MLGAAALLSAGEPWVRWDWVFRHAGDIGAALRQHIELTVLAVAIGFCISLPLGVAGFRWKRFRGPILSVSDILYIFPRLPSSPSSSRGPGSLS